MAEEKPIETDGDTKTIWQDPIPKDGAPGIFGKYDTWDKAAEAQASLQTGFNESNKKLKDAEAKIKELEDAKPVEKPDEPDADDPPAAADQKPWQDAFRKYVAEGGLEAGDIQALSQQYGVPATDIVDFMEFKKASRDRLIESAKSEVEGADIPTIEAWIQSGKSPFSEHVVRGFEELAGMGDMSWLKTAWAKYQEFVNDGGMFEDPTTGKAYGAPPQYQQGRPAPLTQPGFKDRDEYVTALGNAKSAGDLEAQAAVRKKLAETPEQVKSTWF